MTKIFYSRIFGKKTNKDDLLTALEKFVKGECLKEDTIAFLEIYLNKWEILIDDDLSKQKHLEYLKSQVASGKVERILVPSLYSIHHNHAKIVSFLEYCYRYNIKIESINEAWLNGADRRSYQMCIYVLQMVAFQIRQYKSNRISEGKKGKRGNQPLNAITKEHVIKLWNEGKTVKQICGVVKVDKHGTSHKLGISTIYKIIKEHKKQNS